MTTACIAFVALRWPLYTHPGLLLGWNSDAALFGLMGRATAAGHFPYLAWGQGDLGALTSVFAAAVGATVVPDVGPLALRLGTTAELLAAILFFHAALRRVVGPGAASLTTVWLAAGPAFLFKLSYAPVGAEQYFFAGAILFWFVVGRSFERLHEWLFLGLLMGLGWWQHRGVVFVILPALCVLAIQARAVLSRRDRILAFAVLTAGAVTGLLPIVFGRLAVDQRLRVAARPTWSIAHVQTRLTDTLTHDFWALIGADTPNARWLMGGILLVLLASAVAHFEVRRETLFAAGVVMLAFAFWIFSTEPYRGAVRYIMITLPILYAFAAREIVRAWESRRRLIAIIPALVITAGLFIPRAVDAREVAEAQREQHEHWPGGFDPRPALSALAAGGYRVCYANFWIAYKLDWLSEAGVRFIPYRSVNATMTESIRLAAMPGPKCFVDLDGRVHPLSTRQQNDLRLEVLWHVHGWRRTFEPDLR